MADNNGAPAPVEAERETPPAGTWRIGRFAVAGGLVVSAIIHLSLVGTVLFVSPRLLHPEPANSVTVDLVTPAELAAMSAKSDKPDTPAEPPKSQPSAAAAPDHPAEPPPPQTQPTPPQPSSPPLDAFATPIPIPQAPSAPPAPAPAPASGQAEQLARLLGMPTPVAGLTGGGPSDYKANLTPDEIAAFAAHVQTCWSGSAALAKATKLKVVIRISLRPDGAFTTEPALIQAPASAQGPALVRSAMQTLQRCQPYNSLPAAKYAEWRLLDLQFSGGGISTASPVPMVQRKQSPG